MAGNVKLMTSAGGGVILDTATTTASDVTVKVPAVNATLLTNKTPGTVLQVVNATYSTETAITSTSYVATGLSATITPTFNTSKILVIVSNMMNCPVGNNSNFTVYRGTVSGGVNLTGAQGFVAYYDSGRWTGVTINYLDSPANTASVTYTCAYKVSGGSGGAVQVGGGTATMTLMEIAA